MKISKDPRILKFLSIVSKGRVAIDSTSLLNEIEELHAARKIRHIDYKEVVKHSQESVIKTSLQNQSYRSRCVEIKIKATRQLNVLFEHKDVIYRYILDEYRNKIPGRTKEERHQYIDYKLEGANSLIARLESVIEVADLVIDDCDKASWVISHLVKTLELSTRPERNI